MKKNSRPLLDGISLLCLAAAAVVLLLCRGQSEFTGDRIKNPDAYLLDIQRIDVRAINVIGEVMLLARRIEQGLFRRTLCVPPLLESLVRETREHKAVAGHVVRKVADVVNPVAVKLRLVGTAKEINLDDTGVNLCLDGVTHLLAFRKKPCR